MTMYEKWEQRLHGYTNLGHVQTLIFQAYQLADTNHRLRLQNAFPNWFKSQISLPPMPEEPINAAITAFQLAINTGRLSDDPKHPNYAGHFMYMGRKGNKDAFKHIQTRQYIE